MLHFNSETVRKPTIWPEWTEAELAAEKWDLGGGKGRAKSSANNVVNSSIAAYLLSSRGSVTPAIYIFIHSYSRTRRVFCYLPPFLLVEMWSGRE